jgi:phospholipid/cholesterol/gamma-HCH transport system permease protein
MSWYKPADLGFGVRRQLAGLGYGARLFGRLLATLLPALRPPGA